MLKLETFKQTGEAYFKMYCDICGKDIRLSSPVIWDGDGSNFKIVCGGQCAEDPSRPLSNNLCNMRLQIGEKDMFFNPTTYLRFRAFIEAF